MVAVMSDIDGHPAFLMLEKIVGLILAVVNNERARLRVCETWRSGPCSITQPTVIKLYS